MDWIRTLGRRITALFGKEKLDDELDEELRTHIEFAVEENVNRGMTEKEARTAALRELGGVTQARENYRVQRGLPFVETLIRDARFAVRQLSICGQISQPTGSHGDLQTCPYRRRRRR